MTNPSAVQLPTYEDRTNQRLVSAVINMAKGRSLAVGTVTLAVSPATTTTVSFENCSENSHVFLTPKTANAAAEVGGGTLYVSSVSNGSFTLTHSASASNDRTFGFAVFG